MTDNKAFLQRAAWWLQRGFNLLPVQPHTKKLVKGYGPSLAHLDAFDQVKHWQRFNLAAVAGNNGLILDFDDPELYTRWVAEVGNLAGSYTERTPRGGAHVFYWLTWSAWRRDIPQVIPGVEVKKLAMVAPSEIDGHGYQYDPSGEVYELYEYDEFRNLFSLLSKATQVASLAEVHPKSKPARTGIGPLAAIKATVTILDILDSHRIEVRNAAAGRRWLLARCPFHDDHDPSMWIDTTRNLWGCHSCDAHGDVVNLEAKLTGSTNAEAIRALAARAVAC